MSKIDSNEPVRTADATREASSRRPARGRERGQEFQRLLTGREQPSHDVAPAGDEPPLPLLGTPLPSLDAQLAALAARAGSESAALRDAGADEAPGALEEPAPAQSELAGSLPGFEPQRAQEPPAQQVASMPATVRAPDLALVQQVVEFAALSRNESGDKEFVFGTRKDFLGGAVVRLIALDGGRLALKVKPGQDERGARSAVAGLAAALREKGLDLALVELE